MLFRISVGCDAYLGTKTTAKCFGEAFFDHNVAVEINILGTISYAEPTTPDLFVDLEFSAQQFGPRRQSLTEILVSIGVIDDSCFFHARIRLFGAQRTTSTRHVT